MAAPFSADFLEMEIVARACRQKIFGFGASVCAVFATAVCAQTTTQSPVVLDINKPYAAADYAFLSSAIGASRVVALGESIHVTREMPRVRLQMVRYLHEQMGFNVIAFEGALLDAWTAQEHGYRDKGAIDERAATMKREMLFGLWQTKPMQDVLAYALRTQASGHPLYVTSFDLQPGMARVYGGSPERSLQAFFAAVTPYDPTIEPARIAQWSKKLGAALACSDESDAGLAVPVVDEIEAWLNGPVANNIAKDRSAVHLAALRLVPTMLRARLQFCHEWVRDKRSMSTYQRARDELNAQLVLDELRELPGPMRLILWAHHSHLHYNSLAKTVPSMGQHLHDALHDEIYTVGVFAQGGYAIDTATIDQAHGLGFLLALAAKPIPSGPRWSVEQQLSQKSPHDFFLDLRHAPKEWSHASTSRLETNGHMPTALSADFDGAVLLHQVSSPDLDFLPSWLRAGARTVGFVVAYPIVGVGTMIALVTCLLYIVGRWRRRRTRAR